MCWSSMGNDAGTMPANLEGSLEDEDATEKSLLLDWMETVPSADKAITPHEDLGYNLAESKTTPRTVSSRLLPLS